MASAAQELRYRRGGAVYGNLAYDLDRELREREFRHAGEVPARQKAVSAPQVRRVSQVRVRERQKISVISVAGFLAVAALVFPLLFFITAPYGRHTRRGWGPTVDNTLGWVLMETPSPLLFAFFFVIGTQTANPVNMAFLAFWLLHYINRTYIFPFRLRAAAKRMPLMIMLSGMTFNAFNGYLNSRWLNTLAPAYDLSWFTDPRFIIGAALFL